MPHDLTAAEKANLNEGVRSWLRGDASDEENAFEIARMLADFEHHDGRKLTPEQLLAAVNEPERERIRPLVPLITRRLREFAERRERRERQRERRAVARWRAKRQTRAARDSLARALVARVPRTTPQPRTDRRHQRAPRRNVRTTPRAARAPGSQDGDDSSPLGSVPPPSSGFWQFLDAASRRMLEHERRREARWRVKVA